MAAPILHPIDTAVSMAKTLGTSPTIQIILFFNVSSRWRRMEKRPCLLARNAAGDVAGAVEGDG